MKNLEGISRIDAQKAQGWYVRIYYPDAEIQSKFFSDGVYGSKEKALQSAKKYREEYIRKNPPPPKLPVHRKKLRNNTSGVHGVSETYAYSKKGEKMPCFSVFWAPKPNVRKVKKFYFHHYSSRSEALKAAAEFRQEKELERLRSWAKKQGQPVEFYLKTLER